MNEPAPYIEIAYRSAKLAGNYRFYGKGVWKIQRDGEWRVINGIYVPADVLRCAAEECRIQQANHESRS